MRRSLAATAAVAVVLAVSAGSATAATDEVSFTVQAAAGGLSLSAAGTTTGIDASGSDPTFDHLSASSVSGSLNAVTVTDVRGTLAGAWTVTVSGEDWVNAANAGVTVGAANGHVYLDAATLPALVTLLGGALSGMVLTSAELNVGVNDLSAAYTLVAGTTTLGNGSVTYTPTIDVTIPASTPAGTYSATVTQTVS